MPMFPLRFLPEAREPKHSDIECECMRLTLQARMPLLNPRKYDEKALIERLRAKIEIDHMDRRELLALVPRLKLKTMPFNRDQALMTLSYTKRVKPTQERKMESEETPVQRFIGKLIAARAEKERLDNVAAGRNIPTDKIGPVIYALRKEKVVTLATLQAATDIFNGDLSKIERGMRTVSEKELDAIASALGTSAEQILSTAGVQHE